jgi:hypothetical protein
LSARRWQRIFYGSLSSRRIPFVLLIAALAGILLFSRGLRLVDTVGMLTCGVIAGGSLAAIAAGRRR